MAYGFGGLGSSFPMRLAAPESQTVDALSPFGDWQADWTRRYGERAATATGPTADRWVSAKEFGPGYLEYIQAPGTEIRSMTPYGGDGAPLTEAFVKGNAGYSPDFTDLNAEKLAKETAYANQTSQQQAYDGMQGNYQFNGMPGAGYSTPGFGQVTGQSDPFAVNAASGVNLPQASGIYGAGAQTGIYNPGGNMRRPWNL